jgi:hypothetical protein
MQIECREGLALGCAGTVERSTVDHSARPERRLFEKMLRNEAPREPEEELCSATRRATTDRGEARRILLMGSVVSCGSGDSLDDHHRSSTLGTEPKISGVLGA